MVLFSWFVRIKNKGTKSHLIWVETKEKQKNLKDDDKLFFSFLFFSFFYSHWIRIWILTWSDILLASGSKRNWVTWSRAQQKKVCFFSFPCFYFFIIFFSLIFAMSKRCRFCLVSVCVLIRKFFCSSLTYIEILWSDGL